MKLSIITINYNNCDGLCKTIESVINQTCKEFQYIVIDGGSTDGSVDIIKEYVGKIDYWVSELDKGVYHAMNKGIDIAMGDYCIFINSGDSFYNHEVIYTLYPHLDGTGVICGNTFLTDNRIKKSIPDISLEYLLYNTLCHQSCCIRTDLLKKYHYDESYKIVSDWKFLIQVLIKDDVTYKAIDETISIFDLSGISSTNLGLLMRERNSVLKELFSDRILIDYRNHYDGWENQLYNGIKSSKYHKYLYTLNVMILKFISFLKKDSWASKFPLRLKD